MGQEGVSLGTLAAYAEQRIVRVKLGPNSVPLEPAVNRFQILTFVFSLLVFIDTCNVWYRY